MTPSREASSPSHLITITYSTDGGTDGKIQHRATDLAQSKAPGLIKKISMDGAAREYGSPHEKYN